jgi:hypothetical protein
MLRVPSGQKFFGAGDCHVVCVMVAATINTFGLALTNASLADRAHQETALPGLQWLDGNKLGAVLSPSSRIQLFAA